MPWWCGAQVRQPWADKDVAPAILNDEQKAYLEQVAKEKAEKEEEEADKGPKVSAACSSPRRQSVIRHEMSEHLLPTHMYFLDGSMAQCSFLVSRAACGLICACFASVSGDSSAHAYH